MFSPTLKAIRCYAAKGVFEFLKKEVAAKILIVLTSRDQLGDTGKKTGFWLEEFAAPYVR